MPGPPAKRSSMQDRVRCHRPTRRRAAPLALTAVVSLVALGGCQDEDVTDEPIFPDNVSATVRGCEVVDGRPVATVEVTNGTGHAAAYEVTVAYVVDGTTEDLVAAETDEIAPGRDGQVQVRSAELEAVDECDLRQIEERRS